MPHLSALLKTSTIIIFTLLSTTLLANPVPVPSSFALNLSPNGYSATAALDAQLIKRGGKTPGQCEDVCPNGSPRVANCATLYDQTIWCFCAGNGLQCTGAPVT